jgi:RNase adaptor protein for sRNA GlmZ degradation
MLYFKIRSFSFKRSPLRTPFNSEKRVEDLHDKEHGGGFVFDCRALPNPGRLPNLSHLSGLDSPVIDYLANLSEVGEFIELSSGLIIRSARNYLSRNFSSILVEFGCTGGQHRSVFCAERVSQFMRSSFERTAAQIEIHHVELGLTKAL